jgi:hypothetical protein
MADEFSKNIERIKTGFYEKQRKNLFFTSKQKLDLAGTVSSSMNLEDLIRRTVFIVSDTNRVYLEYNLFKLYANPANYEILVRYIIHLFTLCVDKYDSFEVHVNLDSFSVSACHRYKDVIETFLNECLKNETVLTEKLSVMHLYNIPSVFDTIQKLLAPFIHETVKRKIDLHSKAESPALITKILS